VSVGTEEGEIALRCSHCTTTARTMDELEAAITTYAPDAAPGTASATPQSTTMDGLDARVLYPVIGATGWMAGGVCHAYAFSGSRPIVLTLECEYFHGFPNNAGLLRDIIDSFRFLDGASSEAELVTHQYAEPGFSVDLPAAWKVAEATGTITAQGTGGTLRVKAGSSGGQISPCGLVAGHPCSDASRTWDAVASGESDSSATTRLADSLAEVLERDWDIAPLLGRVLVRESTSLGEADAIRLRLDGQYCPSDCTWRYVVAVRGGQPWVIAYQPDDMVPRLFADILPTFRFLGDAPEADSEWVGQAIRDQAAGFEIRVPRFWTVNSSPGTFHMRDNGTSLTIRIGDADGRLVTCQTPARPWERCRDVQITNLEEFRDAVATGPPEGCGWCIPGATNTSSTLGGEAAWRIAFFGYEYPAQSSETALYVLALHDGRPFFIRFHTSANGQQEGRRALWDEILETVRFLP
jgi:hypothetical protein